MIRTILVTFLPIIWEIILAVIGVVSLTVGFYPIYKESIVVSIERSTTKFENMVYSQDPNGDKAEYVASIIESFLDLLNKVRRKKTHDGILLTGGFTAAVLFFAYLLQREVILVDMFLDQGNLVTDLFVVGLFSIALELILAIRLILLIGSPYNLSSEEVEKFIGRM